MLRKFPLALRVAYMVGMVAGRRRRSAETTAYPGLKSQLVRTFSIPHLGVNIYITRSNLWYNSILKFYSYRDLIYSCESIE